MSGSPSAEIVRGKLIMRFSDSVVPLPEPGIRSDFAVGKSEAGLEAGARIRPPIERLAWRR